MCWLSGKGWYDYEKGSRKPLHSAEVAALIDAHRTETGRYGCKADLGAKPCYFLLTPSGLGGVGSLAVVV